MIPVVQWVQPEEHEPSLLAKLQLIRTKGVIVDDSFPATLQPPNGTRSDKTHVEGFCAAKYSITAEYNLFPLTDLTITLRKPEVLRVSGDPIPGARKLLYKPVHAEGCEERYRQSMFSTSLKPASFDISINFLAEEQFRGVLFRLELEDGSTLSQVDGTDFCIGHGKQSSPYTLEVPFPWPFDRKARMGKALSLYRSNLFWLQPQLDNKDLGNLLHETSFVLIQLEPTGNSDCSNFDEFVCVVIAGNSDPRLRLTAFGTTAYSALRIESRCLDYPLFDEVHDMTVAYSARASDPFSAIQAAIETYSTRSRTFSSRFHKLSSTKWDALSREAAVLNRLGYCTWDALGHNCSEESVLEALKWFQVNEIPIGYMVLDDGWQDGGASGPLSEDDPVDEPSPRLTSFHANSKFPRSLRPLVTEGGPIVYVWMTIIGYWGGADGSSLERDTIRLSLSPSVGLNRNVCGQTKMWEREYEIIAPDTGKIERFFRDYFTELFNQGVRGVKIDAQSLLRDLSAPTRHPLVHDYRSAISRAAEGIFPGQVILNSMCCASEKIAESGVELSVANACWRTSDDHAFPGVAETDGMVAWHVLRNGMSSLFVGEVFPVTDWDMFLAVDRNAYIHAVARVVSGGPVYISDSVPVHAEGIEMLGRLVTGDGRILRCQEAGRPTRDCIFGDAREGRMFKIFNRNATSGIIGLFNVSTREDGDKIREGYCCADVEDFRKGPDTGFVSVVIGRHWRCAFRHGDKWGGEAITLWPMEAALVHVYPVLGFGDGLSVAVVGRLDRMNCGGVVQSVAGGRAEEGRGWAVEVGLSDWGRLAVWLGEQAAARLVQVVAGGEVQKMTHFMIDQVSFLEVDVPEPGPGEDISVRLRFEDAG